MSYLDVALRNIAGRMPANFRDNNMRASDPTPRKTGLRILATGTGSSGIKDSLFEVNTPSVAAAEFGADSELVRVMDQVLAQNPTADLQLMRVGSFPGHLIVSRAIVAGSKEQEILIRISPRVSVEANVALGQQATFDSLKVIFAPFTENGVVRQRVLLFNANDSTPVFDSENKIVADGSSVFDLELNVPVGSIIVSAGLVAGDNSLIDTIQNLSDRLSWSVSTLGKTLTALATADLKAVSTITSSVDSSFGDLVVSKHAPAAKNKSLTPSQRYYANELAYQFIDTIRPDMIYCEGCTADTPSVEIDDLASHTQKQIWQQSHLGKMWKADFEGKPYSFFFSRSNPFDVAHVASTISRSVIVAAGKTADCAFSYSNAQKAIGDLHALVDVHVEVKDAVTATSVEWFPTLKGEVEVHVVATSGSLNAGLGISTPFFSGTITGANLVDGKSFSVRPLPLKVGGALTYSAIGTQNFVLTPWDLAQEPVPEAVLGRLFSFSEEGASPLVLTLEAANTEVREVSFLHQSAFNAYRASTNYSQSIAVVATSRPNNLTARGFSAWAGDPCKYKVNQLTGELEVSTNGTGILGYKLLSGSTDYRGGKAFGGIILTRGESLPSDLPYGIDDTDEATDQFGKPIDLGKHVVVVGQYSQFADPYYKYINSTFAQRASYSGSAAPMIAARVATLEPGTEPIGPVLGALTALPASPVVSPAVLDNLAALRVCMVSNGYISSIYTSALPTSDYRKLSSIMSANFLVGAVRRECISVIGQAYSDAQIQSLKARLDGLSRSAVALGYAQTMNVSLSASQLDRINGVLKASIRFVPPMSIEEVSIDITLDAPSAGI
jgi:hypothetical protein